MWPTRWEEYLCYHGTCVPDLVSDNTVRAEVIFSNRGKAYGTFNIKTLYLASVAIFEIGSALCGAAQNMDMMIVGRVITGLGGNGMYTGCLTCM